jgi:hypothetical protein
LGGEMLAEISVEEDVPALRNATPQPLPGGRSFRVIAIDATTKKLYSYADYTVPFTAPQNGTLTGFVLPASGFRDYVSGTLGDVGKGGYYWSGSAISGTD